ncbi:MAG: hypothetical protein ACOXZP_01925 [Minisyncoccales bacterium]
MLIFKCIQSIILSGIGIFTFIILAFVFINTGTIVKNENNKLYSIIYLTILLTFILISFLFGLHFYNFLIAFTAGFLSYKVFN